MTYDEELTLIKKTVTYDELGIPLISEAKTTILCNEKSVARTEFYTAAAIGLKPEIVFVIHEDEYQEQQIVEYDGKRYDVLRTYVGDKTGRGYQLAADEMELVCGQVVASGKSS